MAASMSAAMHFLKVLKVVSLTRHFLFGLLAGGR